ncbi:MAG: hypothetical protein ACI4JY_07540 [Oscillospiraceae bacterium]
MKISLMKRICAVALCLCTLLLSGCTVNSIVDPGEVYNSDFNDNPYKVPENNNTVIYKDTYATGGVRAFKFEDCDEYTEITDFQYIALLGDTFVYYYSVTKAGGERFYAIAAYNFNTTTYTEIIKRSFDESESFCINCNHVQISKNIATDGTASTAQYLINVGYSFFKVTLTSTDGKDFLSGGVEEWTIGSDMLLMIKSYFTGDLASTFDIDVVVSDIAPWATYADIYSVAFVNISATDDEADEADEAADDTDEAADTAAESSNFVEQTVLMKVQLTSPVSQDGSNTVQRSLQAEAQEFDIQSTEAGSILSADNDAKDCVFIRNIGSRIITFGKCDQTGTSEFEVTKKSTDKLITYSVVNDGDSTNFTLLQLVYQNRLEYWRLGIDIFNPSSTEFGAIFVTSFPLRDSSSYWVAENTPSITYDSTTNTVTLASNKYGVKQLVNTTVYDEEGNEIGTETTEKGVDYKFSAYLTEPYGNDLLLVGFDELKFDRVTETYNAEGNLLKTKASKEYYTLAQLPFATVRIKTLLSDDSPEIPEENLTYKDTYAAGERAFVFPIIEDNTQSADSQGEFVKITDVQDEYTQITDFQYIGLLGDTFIYYYRVIDENEERRYSVAAYNFKTKTYTEIVRRNIDESESGIIKCNAMLISKNIGSEGSASTAKYLVNVGYSFFKITLSASDAQDFSPSEIEEWSIDSNTLNAIKGFFVGNLGSTMGIEVAISDIAPWATYADMYSVAFTSSSANGSSDFVPQTILVKITLSKTVLQDETNTVYRTMQAQVQARDIKSTKAGTLLAVDTDLKNCVYIKNIAADKITFGKCDQSGKFEFDVKKNSSDELISFSVVNDGDSTNNTLLQLVYSDRLEYLSLGSDTSDSPSASFGATFVTKFTLDDSMGVSESEDLPSISYDSKTRTVTLASYKYGVIKLENHNVYDEEGLNIVDTKTIVEKVDSTFSTYLTEPYGYYLLLVGFKGLQFNRANGYYDTDGNFIKLKDTQEDYTLAQMPFAKVNVQ